jgi:hypothetical protein
MKLIKRIARKYTKADMRATILLTLALLQLGGLHSATFVPYSR